MILLNCGELFLNFWIEKTLKSPLGCKEIQPVNPKGNQSWISIGRTNVETEAPILWPPDAKNQLIGKDSDAGKDWGQEEKGTTEDEMVGWHHRLNGHEFGQAPGVGDGQGGLACCSPWGHDWVTELNSVTILLSFWRSEKKKRCFKNANYDGFYWFWCHSFSVLISE